MVLPLLAGALVALLAGVLSPMVVTRNMAFSVHATAEVGFAGGEAALLFGIDVGAGAIGAAVLTALVLGLLGQRASERDSVTGVVLALGLGLGVLCLALYHGPADAERLLTGNVFGVGTERVAVFAAATAVVLGVLAATHRPLQFAGIDPEQALARGVPTRSLNLLFAVLVGITTALAVQLVGSLLVISLMITPGAAATRGTARPGRATALGVAFAEAAMLGGIGVFVASGLPARDAAAASAFVTVVSFAIYAACRVAGHLSTGPQFGPKLRARGSHVQHE